MNKKAKESVLAGILFFIAGITFIISAVIGENNVYIPIGCCFIILGIVFSMKYKRNTKNKDNK